LNLSSKETHLVSQYFTLDATPQVPLRSLFSLTFVNFSS